jgi:ADP-ribosylglycohydrolase
MGKNIGGTLGAPFEWKRQVNNVSFYTQKLSGEPLPNDDLDIQLLWLVALEERGLDLDAQVLAEYWVLYVTPHWSEYGTAKVNMRSGLMPPLSGIFNNDYKDSCGAFIRSEIWACITPGLPRLAAKYAYEDAILDHGDGEGVYAEVFCASLESAAFVEKDAAKLLEIGLSYIPTTCGVAKAIRCAMESYGSGKSWLEARDTILREHRGDTFFGMAHCISADDVKKGFADGKRGWDVPSNIGMLVIGLLYGEGDFDKSVCIAVNCGEDTDCTGATIGSIFGILHGIDAIPDKWIKPIGRKIKTACLNLGELGYFGSQLPADIDVMTDRTERLARQIELRHKRAMVIDDRPTDLADLQSEGLLADEMTLLHFGNPRGPVFHFDFFDVAVDYGDGPTICDGQPKSIRLQIRNRYKVQANLNVHCYLPEGWRVLPAGDGLVGVLSPNLGQPQVVELAFQADRITRAVNRLVVELTSEGRPTVMLVPIVLMSGNLWPR